jgi:DNA-binding Lrp family transcriptional regulator
MIIPEYLDFGLEYNNNRNLHLMPTAYETIKEINLTTEGPKSSVFVNHFPKLSKASISEDDYLLSLKDLSELDQRILFLLNEQLWSTFTFKALERKLNIHQQTLTRSLKRLLELKLIIKSSRGYQINEINTSWLFAMGEDPINSLLTDVEITRSKRSRKFKQFLQVYVPIRMDIEAIISTVSGKWFGNLRWLGLVKKDTGYRLEWVAIDKYSNESLFNIIVNIVTDYIIVESDAENQEEKIDAMASSNRIVGDIIKIVKNNVRNEKETDKKFHKIYANDIKYSVKKGK